MLNQMLKQNNLVATTVFMIVKLKDKRYRINLCRLESKTNLGKGIMKKDFSFALIAERDCNTAR